MIPVSNLSHGVDRGNRIYYTSMKTRKRFYYKGMPVNIFGTSVSSSSHKSKEYFSKNRRLYLKSFVSEFNKKSPKNLIVMYDIPHKKKVVRDWFRRQLKIFGYIMIQRSVWVGPSPLPKEFLAYVKELQIEKEFKTFKLARSYI